MLRYQQSIIIIFLIFFLSCSLLVRLVVWSGFSPLAMSEWWSTARHGPSTHPASSWRLGRAPLNYQVSSYNSKSLLNLKQPNSWTFSPSSVSCCTIVSFSSLVCKGQEYNIIPYSGKVLISMDRWFSNYFRWRAWSYTIHTSLVDYLWKEEKFDPFKIDYYTVLLCGLG